MRAASLIVFQCLFPLSVRAEPVTVGPIVISVPDGFQAAQTQRARKTVVSAWTKSVRNGSVKTLLQVNVMDLGSTPGRTPLSESELATGAEQYLRQFLAGVERRRSSYAASPIAHIRLAGVTAARASWNGALGDRSVVGVIYSVILRNRFAVILHTQDLGSAPTEGMFEAMRAIETVVLADAGA